MNIATLIITAILNGIIGAVVFFILLISMNGFSERQATPGLLLFIIWVVLTAIMAGVLSFLTVKYLIDKKSMGAIVAALMAVTIFTIIGGISNIVGMLAAILLATALR
jgi:hypothetical protein